MYYYILFYILLYIIGVYVYIALVLKAYRMKDKDNINTKISHMIDFTKLNEESLKPIIFRYKKINVLIQRILR